jgi:hypothetical protein
MSEGGGAKPTANYGLLQSRVSDVKAALATSMEGVIPSWAIPAAAAAATNAVLHATEERAKKAEAEIVQLREALQSLRTCLAFGIEPPPQHCLVAGAAPTQLDGARVPSAVPGTRQPAVQGAADSAASASSPKLTYPKHIVYITGTGVVGKSTLAHQMAAAVKTMTDGRVLEVEGWDAWSVVQAAVETKPSNGIFFVVNSQLPTGEFLAQCHTHYCKVFVCHVRTGAVETSKETAALFAHDHLLAGQFAMYHHEDSAPGKCMWRLSPWTSGELPNCLPWVHGQKSM